MDVIIGGAGFIGSNLCARLLKDGCKVIVIDNLSLGNLDNIKGMDIMAFHNVDATNTELLKTLLKI